MVGGYSARRTRVADVRAQPRGDRQDWEVRLSERGLVKLFTGFDPSVEVANKYRQPSLSILGRRTPTQPRMELGNVGKNDADQQPNRGHGS